MWRPLWLICSEKGYSPTLDLINLIVIYESHNSHVPDDIYRVHLDGPQ